MKDKNNVENLIPRIEIEKQLTKIGKIGNKKCLICDNLVVLGDLNKLQVNNNIFKCAECNEMFHRKCMQR